MISPLPFPHWDIVTCQLSMCNPKFRNHYMKDTPIDKFNVCKECKKECTTHHHHIVPRSELGLHHQSNLIELCPSCHKKADNGTIYVGEGKKFRWGVKKHEKIKRKLAVTKLSKEDFFNLHLECDGVMKGLIKIGDVGRIQSFIQERLSFMQEKKRNQIMLSSVKLNQGSGLLHITPLICN